MSWRFFYEPRRHPMITVKVYLKSKHSPVTLVFDKQTQFDEYMQKLLNYDIINVGMFAFAKSEFRYQIVSEKK